MNDFSNERKVKKTRKDHKCIGCRGKLSKGSTAFYISGVYEGDFGSYYLCIPCREYLYRYPGEFSEGDLGDARCEEETERKGQPA